METIGEKIRELRKGKKVSQEELAFKLGVSRQTIYKWEDDAMQPNANNVKALCDFFCVSSDCFFSDRDRSAANETAVADAVQKSEKFSAVFIVITAVVSLAFILSVGFTVCCGLIVFSDNTGHEKVCSLEVRSYLFYLFLILSLILFALDIIAVFYLKKCKANFCG